MFFKKTVTCEKCGVVLSKEKAHKVIINRCEATICFYGYVCRTEYYCPNCAPKYDYVKHPDSIYNPSYVPSEYYARLEVDEDGCPVGYVKLDDVVSMMKANEILQKAQEDLIAIKKGRKKKK